jgi:hypothetical protein
VCVLKILSALHGCAKWCVLHSIANANEDVFVLMPAHNILPVGCAASVLLTAMGPARISTFAKCGAHQHLEVKLIIGEDPLKRHSISVASKN